MRLPHWIKGISWESIPARILLAHNPPRCGRYSHDMLTLRVPFQENTPACPSSSDNPSIMAILDLGARYPRLLPPSNRGFEFLFVAIDKFTKWPEVPAMRKVTAQSAIKFLKELVCRFGVPARIITDNSTQFMSRAFMQYVHALGCKISFASVAHPRSNGQAERANAEVLRGLKTRTFDTLQKHGRRWIEELLVVLWPLKMTPNRATERLPST